jgi:SpoVK/Ycf46/Vps4 family AAA+-type ATPase
MTSSCEINNENKVINVSNILRHLRRKINTNMVKNAVGLTNLTPRPWSDYICPESSNFTYDIKKLLRDFREIEKLKADQSNLMEKGKDDSVVTNNISAIQSRMPHVIMLYGKGGTGKSAFPVHLAGLLDFDIWDFNAGASHSKWVGEGAKNMREALDSIKKITHTIIRIDEYDRAIGSTSASGTGMHEAHKQVESEFMNWLQNVQEDGILVKNNIFLVMTTNHKDNITGPLLRSGRCDLVIDIADFDAKSMEQAFITAPQRVTNRGVTLTGLHNNAKFAEAIGQLDCKKLSEIATEKGFTVRDIDILLQEMATHSYYHKQGMKGLSWDTESFIKVMERSTGSVAGEDTGELVLGDRFIIDEKKDDSQQTTFDFYKECSNEFNVEKFTDVEFFK